LRRASPFSSLPLLLSSLRISSHLFASHLLSPPLPGPFPSLQAQGLLSAATAALWDAVTGLTEGGAGAGAAGRPSFSMKEAGEPVLLGPHFQVLLAFTAGSVIV
jgi:hypothetical protein